MKIAVLLATAALGLAALPAQATEAAAGRPTAQNVKLDLAQFATGQLKNLTVSETAKPVALAPFRDEAGNEIDLSAFRGKVVLVNLWATWCVPCRTEMPALDRLQRDLGGPDFQVVAVAQERAGPAKARAFLDEVGAKSLALFVDQSMKSARAWGAVGLPTTFLIDRRGNELARLIGAAEWDSPEAIALVRAAIAAP